MMPGDDKPVTTISFTAAEKAENVKTSQMIQVEFQRMHVEITALANNDQTKYIREQSLLYANLAVDFTVQYLAAQKKKRAA